jgi:hypothetical protein
LPTAEDDQPRRIGARDPAGGIEAQRRPDAAGDRSGERDQRGGVALGPPGIPA